MNHKSIVLGTLLAILILIVGGTIWKVYQDHSSKTLLVVEKRIIESALNCINDDLCTDEKITLGFLIDHGYGKEEVNPKTKLYYDHASYVIKENNEYIFKGI